ncbi:CDP-alcohol phosphatidyltransferase family protein [Benzoatithermus flavus]|uniref:CDP-alcohol phosphatidyltransferase family protein n=1 Tax=Benzoatithermus flavus TaxID=3108223 RepID=A0ABU8XZ03_9PROT
MLDAALRPLIDPPLDRIGRALAARGVSADAITVTGFGLGLLAMLAIAGGAYGTGLVLLLLNRLADGLDGAVARHSRLTDLGGFLDIVLDFITYAGLVFAFAVAEPAENGLAAAFLLFAFMGTGSSFLAFAIMAAKRRLATERRGRKSLYYLGGLTEGSETILFFVLACLLPGWFPLLACLFGGLCWLTTLGRILAGRQLLRDAGDAAA